jgi:(p)ppGpp synthase/HD superfamily hydrolase
MPVETARDLAIAAHGTQTYGQQPYRVHLAEVADICATLGFDEPEVLAAAWLHDVVEDTETTDDDLAGFTALTRFIVGFCTDEPGPSRAVRKRATYRRMRHSMSTVDPEWATRAAAVKLSDRAANLRACVRTDHQRLLAVYRGEHETLFLTLYNGDPRLEALWAELDRLVY